MTLISEIKMDIKRARRILKHAGAITLGGISFPNNHTLWRKGDSRVYMDGMFYWEELEAIAEWMKDDFYEAKFMKKKPEVRAKKRLNRL